MYIYIYIYLFIYIETKSNTETPNPKPINRVQVKACGEILRAQNSKPTHPRTGWRSIVLALGVVSGGLSGNRSFEIGSHIHVVRKHACTGLLAYPHLLLSIIVYVNTFTKMSPE